jgi:hypothetical protein
MRMRHRLDLGTILQAAGALVLLASLFVRWFDPGGTAWQVFELTDLLLALAALAVIVVAALRLAAGEPGTPGWAQAVSAAALLVVVVELVEPPPVVDGATRTTGAWLALGGALAMALGALLHRAHISVSIDVSERDPRPRVPAVDRRGSGAAGGEEAPQAARRGERGDDVRTEPLPGDAGRATPSRRGGTPAAADLPDPDALERTEPIRPVRGDDEA